MIVTLLCYAPAIRTKLRNPSAPFTTPVSVAFLDAASAGALSFFRNRACGLLGEKNSQLNSRQKIGKHTHRSADALLSDGNRWRSLGDSNPCFRRERRATGTSAN